ncbi:hypothetical protein P154DRAFT_520925 [Amniculicola lignicola CBS 123094]|uniref:[histone H3]-trimethyl-L-lysine(9) demethylase n=1 Tax=Amniculicola lignicola CBS 123094 TaxID=1392246 RepID=A0A6A5WN48_9PLEO|nr:hypothetical protein P154DRAFT_520925 [Amniculicola lignicola CBS 123094]
MEAPVEVIPSIETVAEKHDNPPMSKPALTPPTSEDMDRKARETSELTDLESDDDGEEIEPDHYFEGGKVPVFKPTMEQFRNFKKFTEKIDKYGMKSGIVKIIPPKEWRNALPDLSEAVKSIKVKNPITQEFAGQHGIYTQANIEKQRSYSLPEWRALSFEAHHQPPAKRGERRKVHAEAPSRTRATRAQAVQAAEVDGSPASRRGPGRPRKRTIKLEDDDNEDEAALDVPPTPKSPPREEAKRSARKVKKEGGEELTPMRGRQPKSTASRRRNNQTAVADYVDESAFENFDYHLENVQEFTTERCKELEDNYWKTINYGQPMYGADMPGSLFDDRTTSWNVAKLPNLLDVLGTKVPGVNTAYLYLGMWKATFAWHLEDVDLYSINYIHFGAPKQWYSISQEDARRFEAAMKSIWPRDAKNCSQFLRHKTYLISPQQLERQFNIKVNRLVHYEGEFVITYPYGYHSGYNIGYNCAESVNFANESWLNFGRIAKKCECESDSVWVDVNEIERKLRGEPTPEYYEETDDEDDEGDNLPSPPPSVVSKSRGKGRKPAANKRKRGQKEPEEAPKPKKVRRTIKIRIKVPGRGMPCVLCPNDVDFDDLLPTDNGLQAHRICADYTPETYISSEPTETVCNVANIGKDRLELKCNYCRSKRGAVFQCSSKKCIRAFHATCAAAAGVQVDLGPMPTFDEEGVEYFYDGYDFRCRFHRPKKRNVKTTDADSLEKDKFIFNYAKKLKPKDVIQFQFLGQDSNSQPAMIYGGLVLENRPGETTVLVEVLPDGDHVEVEWKYILAMDPTDSLRPKPSANAKPLPVHLKDNDPSLAITNRTDGVPEIGDPFLDPNAEQKWSEFNTAPEVTQKLAKVDFSKENRLWHYLGKTSTEARPQYTHDPAIPKHNIKSNFLDTVRPAPLPIQNVERRSYPASYPIKPSPVSIPRTPMQTEIRPAPDRPYQYKPREQNTAWKSPVYHTYSPDTRKNPNSPVAHQPNVAYDRGASAPQYGYPSHSSGQQRPPPVQTYHNYGPPQNYMSTWRPQPPPTSGPLLHGIDHYAQSNQSRPSYPYYPAPPATAIRELPPFPYSQPPQAPLRSPVYNPPAHQTSASQGSSSSRSAAPLANILSAPAGTTKPSIQDGGFNPEWMSRMASGPTSTSAAPAIAPRPSASSHRSSGGTPQGLGSPYAGVATPNLPAPRPMPQFQTADAFQRDVAHAQPAPTGLAKWEHMVKQLGHITAPASQSSITPSAVPTSTAVPFLPPPRSQNFPHDQTKTTTPPVQSHTPPHPHPSEISGAVQTGLGEAQKSPERPQYSPISDDGKDMADGKPTLPPLGQIHAGETWRYS